MASMTISFTLDDKTDRDILRWLNSQPKKQRSKAIREALRAHIGYGGVTLGDVYEAIQDLRRQGLVVVAQRVTSAYADEPPDVAAALDSLGL